MKIRKCFLTFIVFFAVSATSQSDSSNNDVEEVVVIGSQIKGAKISGALPVSVISSEDIEALGIDSGV